MARMRTTIAGTTLAVATLALAAPAQGATVVVFADPMTMERRTVVVDPGGPDRAFLCMLPPATSGCQAIPIRRRRS